MTGGPIDQASVCLRIFGDVLDPDTLTLALGCNPSEAARKGERLKRKSNRIAQRGFWRLESDTEQQVEPEVQILRLFERLTDDLDVWHQITQQHDVDLFCGLFLNGWNRGFILSPAVLQRMSERSISVSFDVYGPVDQWEGPVEADEIVSSPES